MDANIRKRGSVRQAGQSEVREEFRSWLRDRIDHMPQSLNAIETSAGIPGNALGKFLRGERGGTHGLTPLNIRRLAPVLGVSEEQLLAKAGHLSHLPDSISVEQAVLADTSLDYEDKRFLIDFYRRMKSGAKPSGGLQKG